MTIALKSQEFISDIIPSTKKAIFKPLLEIQAKEIYSTTIICGRRKFNVKGGAEFIAIKASEECPCGAITTENVLLTAGKKEERGLYLMDSYFDKNYKSQSKKYEEILLNYFEKYTEDHFMSRTSGIAFDILHSVEIPNETRSSDLGSDLEFSNLSESYVIRTFGNGFVINASTDAIHRIEKIMQYYNDCDILPYVEKEKVQLKNQLSPATADDYDALINEVPMRILIFKLKNSSILIKEWDHEKSKGMRRYLRQNSGLIKKNQVLLDVKIDESTIELKEPLYKNRLIYTTCQLPDSINNELFQKCFMAIDLSFKNVKVDMKFEGCKRICEVLKVNSSVRNLIYPHLWEEHDIRKNYSDVEIDGFSLMMNPPQLLVTNQILSSMILKVPLVKEIDNNLLKNLSNPELVVIQVTSRILTFSIGEMNKVFIARLLVSDLIGIAWKSGTKSIVFNIPDSILKSPKFSLKEKLKSSEKMIKMCFQIPKDLEEGKMAPVITLNTSEGCINLDPLFREFLSFKLEGEEVKNDKRLRTLSTSTKPVHASSNNYLTSIQSSSDCDATICPPNEKEVEVKELNFLDHFEKVKNYIVNVEIKALQIFYSTSILESTKASDSIKAMIQKSNADSCVIKLPSILFHSVKNKSFLDLVSSHFPQELPISLWGNEKCFTWNLALDGFEAYSTHKNKNYELIHNISFNISIADENSSAAENKVAGNLLIEASPIQITLHTSQVELLKEIIQQIENFNLIKNISGHKKESEDEIVKIPDKLEAIEESPQNASDIKDFLGLATGSTTTKTSHAENRNKSEYNFFRIFFRLKIYSRI